MITRLLKCMKNYDRLLMFQKGFYMKRFNISHKSVLIRILLISWLLSFNYSVCKAQDNVMTDKPVYNNPGVGIKINITANRKINDDAKIDKKLRYKKLWKTIKGEPVGDALLLGMQSYHTCEDGALNGTNNLVGIEYKGYTAGTFKNSFRNQSAFAGVAREIYSKSLSKDTTINFQYKLGGVYGYGNKYPNIAGVSPLLFPVIGVDYKKAGFDITVIPSLTPIIAGSLKFYLPGK